MIDNFSLGLTHALLLLAAWRLLSCDRIDREPADADPPAPPPPPPPAWHRSGRRDA